MTVAQWVAFLNTVDPKGSDAASPLRLLGELVVLASVRPGIDFSSAAASGRHYTVAYAQWAAKPYGFATFLRAAQFANSLTSGKVLARRPGRAGGFTFVTYKVRLSRETERGMYDLARQKRTGATRARRAGFVVPSQNRWSSRTYSDPKGGGTLSYWKYPTDPGVFGDGTATAPGRDSAGCRHRQRHECGNAAAGELQAVRRHGARMVSPLRSRPRPARPSTRSGSTPPHTPRRSRAASAPSARAATRSPWGTLDQGGNAVEWTDTITALPRPPWRAAGLAAPARWRSELDRLPMWISAVGLQPQDNTFFVHTYPWLGFRIGYVG